MIDTGFINTEVDSLIKRYNETYPQSELLTNKKGNIFEAFMRIMNDGKVSKEFEKDIHKIFLDSINQNIETAQIDSKEDKDNSYVIKMLDYYGDEIGGFLLYCNNSIFKICSHHSEKYNNLIL